MSPWHTHTMNPPPTSTPTLRAQSLFSFRPGCSGNTVRTAFRSRPTSLGEMWAPSRLAITPGTPPSPTHASPPQLPWEGWPWDYGLVGSRGAPRATPPEVLTAGRIWLWVRAVPPKAVMVKRGTHGAGQAVWAECSTSSRCGLMLTLATNLLLWLLAVSNDSMHHEIEAELSALMKKLSGKRRRRPPHL